MGPSLGDGESYLQSGKATYCQAKLPTVRQAPNRSIDLHPTTAYLHPRVSAYFAPSNRILCTQPLHRLAPNFRILCTQTFHKHAPKRHRDFAPKSSRIHAPKLCDFFEILKVCRMVQDLSKSVPRVFRSPGKALIKLFHFIFNSKCHFSKVFFYIIAY